MRTGFPFLSRFLFKLAEIVGAGLASAGGAFLLGHIATSAAPPPVVQIVPADAETIRMVRGDQMVVDELRKDVAGASKPAVVPAPKTTPATASVKVEKVVKAVHAPSARREHKAESVHMEATRVVTGADARWPELPVRITPASQSAEQPTLSQVGEAADLSRPLPAPAPAQTTSEGHFRLFAALRQIPAWLLPNTDRFRSDAPRPPLPVGQFWQRTM